MFLCGDNRSFVATTIAVLANLPLQQQLFICSNNLYHCSYFTFVATAFTIVMTLPLQQQLFLWSDKFTLAAA